MCAGSCALCESWTHLLQQPAIAPLSTSAFHRHTHPLLLSDCSMLVLSVILRNLCSSAPNYSGSLNWPWLVRKEGSEVVEPHPGPSSVLLGSWPHLCVASQTECHLHNHLSPPNESSPAFLHLHIRETSFQSGKVGWEGRANRKTMSTNPKRNSDSVANEGGDEGCVVCKSASDVFLALAIPTTPIPLQTAQTVPCASIPGCMIPPAIPIISGYFIISGCSHNSDLNGWCVLVH